jgi:diguanylate cyclase (GGDEF)-like protein/PAS domain S-box-containing protein
MVPDQDRIRELLRLARDTCTGIAAFLASGPSDVTVVVSPSEAADLEERVARLAESTYQHPRVGEGDLIWNAEIPEDPETASESIACVALPLKREETLLGVLGVVDFWLPEIDDELRGLLGRIADQLAQTLIAGIARPPLETSRPAQTPSETRPEEASPETAPLPPAAPQEPAEEKPSQAAPDRPSPEPAPPPPVPPAEQPSSYLVASADRLPDGIVVAAEDGTLLYASRGFASLARRPVEELIGTDLTAILREESPEDGPARLVARLLGSSGPGRRAILRLPQGRELPVEVRGQSVGEGPAAHGYAALVRDARQAMAGSAETLSPAVLSEILESLDDAVVVTDDDARIVVANRAARILLAFGPEQELVGRPFPFSSGLHTPDGSRVRYEDHPLVQALRRTTVRAEHLVVETAEEKPRHLLVSARPFPFGSSSGALLVAREITAQLDEQARLMQLALHDPLTGLANRYLLLDHLQRSFRQIRSRGGNMALLYLDLDDFKSVNDQYGHDVGDEVLIAIAKRLQSAARAGDLVARLSGDEFVVVATSAGLEPDSIDLVTARIRKALTAPYHVRGRSFSVSASVGWVLADPRSEDPNTLLVRADEEMYRRKLSQKARRGSGGRT